MYSWVKVKSLKRKQNNHSSFPSSHSFTSCWESLQSINLINILLDIRLYSFKWFLPIIRFVIYIILKINDKTKQASLIFRWLSIWYLFKRIQVLNIFWPIWAHFTSTFYILFNIKFNVYEMWKWIKQLFIIQCQ